MTKEVEFVWLNETDVRPGFEALISKKPTMKWIVNRVDGLNCRTFSVSKDQFSG
jgi:hypothetical protein